jgi:lysophospholipase L1-like esterase
MGHFTFKTGLRIERLGQTPKSDNYFMLIGVNDKLLLNLTAEQTVANIEKIAGELTKKNPNAKIFVSTLLPTVRQDLNTQNNLINGILRTKLNCKNCILVDTGAMFSMIKDWPSLTFDGVHPKAEGYEKIAEYIVPIINKNQSEV